jgi:hypothetical protein
MIDMCAAAGIRPIITTTAQDGTRCCNASDMADLIELISNTQKKRGEKERRKAGARQ